MVFFRTGLAAALVVPMMVVSPASAGSETGQVVFRLTLEGPVPALVLLTKVTPGLGVLWFALRREWRRLAFALGTTLAIVAFSAAFTPVLWIEWLRLLAQAAAVDTLTMEPIVPLPLVVRAPVAIAILVWGARTDRFWSVPVAACLALPAIQLGGFAHLVAAIPLLRLPLAPRWPLAGSDHTARGNVAYGVVGLSGHR